MTIIPATLSPSGPGGGGGVSSPITPIPANPLISITPTVPSSETNTSLQLLPTQSFLTPSGITPSGQQIFTLENRITDYVCPKIVKVFDTEDIISTDIEKTRFFDDARAVMMFRGLEQKEFQIGQTYLEYRRFGIALNDSRFEPYRNVTRAEYVKMLVRALSCHYIYLGMDTGFPDVEASMWYAEYIKFAVTNGWIHGYADGNFRPNAPITRDEAAKMLARAIKLNTR